MSSNNDNYNWSEHSKFKKIWDKLTVDEKERHAKNAELGHMKNIKNCRWNEIESNFQSKLRDQLRKEIIK